MSIKLNWLKLSLSLIFLISCSKSNNLNSNKVVLADLNISKSFAPIFTQENINTINSNENFSIENYNIKLQKSALEKEFLLQTSIIEQPKSAMSKGLKSRIVAFRKRSDKLYMLETNEGHSVTNELPQNLILAEFDIKSENENEIIFDFNKGMANIFSATEWRGSDLDDKEYNPKTEFAIKPLEFSFLEEAKIENNHLVIRQIGQYNLKDDYLVPVELKYYITPYRKSEIFTPTKAQINFDRLGYFETAQLSRVNQIDTSYNTKFDLSKPIIFAISSNTPDNFKEAIKDGILYWNQAFGYEAIKIIDAPVGVTAPDVNYNVVQWVTLDNAGYAYADAQVDPRTGETLHAQVYLTSVFALSGKKEAKKFIENWSKTSNSKNNLKTKTTLKGFEAEKFCNYDINESQVESIRNLLIDEKTDNFKILKASQDYIRELAAHEIGHTLGLRHNFAGSLFANYKVNERKKLNQMYFKQGQIPDNIVTTSSVMDYENYLESIWSGDKIARRTGAFSYDEKSIQFLYQGKNLNQNEIPLFCTDSQLDDYGDCKKFDVGNSYFESIEQKDSEISLYIAQKLFLRFIYAISPPNGELAIPLNSVTLPDINDYAIKLNNAPISINNSLNSKFKLLSINRKYPISDTINSDDIFKEQLDYLNENIKSNGNFLRYLNPNFLNLIEESKIYFSNILNTQEFGIGNNDNFYNISKNDKIIIMDRANAFYNQLSKVSFKFYVDLLSGKSNLDKSVFKIDTLPNHQISYDFAKSLYDISKKIIFETNTNYFKLNLGSDNYIEIPNFKHSFEIRKLAIDFLKEGRSEVLNWGLYERVKLGKEYKDFLKNLIKNDVLSIKANEISDPKSSLWILENQKIRRLIGD